jgi:hypothetical protein
MPIAIFPLLTQRDRNPKSRVYTARSNTRQFWALTGHCSTGKKINSNWGHSSNWATPHNSSPKFWHSWLVSNSTRSSPSTYFSFSKSPTPSLALFFLQVHSPPSFYRILLFLNSPFNVGFYSPIYKYNSNLCWKRFNFLFIVANSSFNNHPNRILKHITSIFYSCS